MSTKTKSIIVVLGLLSSFAVGRYSVPESTKESKDSSEQTDSKKKKKTVTEETEAPDGTKKKKTTVTEETEKSKSKTDKESKEVFTGSSKVTVGALLGIRVYDANSQSYGLLISKPILGPITVGAFYLTPGILGASLGLTF